MQTRRVLVYLVVVGVMSVTTACTFNPFGSGKTSVSPTESGSGEATQSAEPTSSVPAGKTKMAKSPAPANPDPLLASGSWGYFTDKNVLESRLSNGVTNAIHQDMVNDEIDALTLNQYWDLLDIFDSSPRVARVIRSEGGDPDDATYTVREIQASKDVAVSTPWVYATLRAEFPTNDGKKAVDCYVYRLKTKKGLDERPFVSETRVGYLSAENSIVNPERVRIVH